MKRAVITGICGQDGTYLYDYLKDKGYLITGVDIKESSLIPSEVILNTDLGDAQKVFNLVKDIKPHEIYHLAAYHRSSEEGKANGDLEAFEESYRINVSTTSNLLEGIYRFSKESKLFYAASSHMFGTPIDPIQNEDTPFNPNCTYGITKYIGTRLCHYYRENKDIFTSVGILYNHESPLRSSNFASKKIVEGAVAIKKNRKDKLIMGDLESEVDFGYAGDYVIAMHKILQYKEADDFVISSGARHKIKDFAKEVFDILGLDWKEHVVVNQNILTKGGKPGLFGDNRKLVSSTGWRPAVGIKELAKIMIEAELIKDGKE